MKQLSTRCQRDTYNTHTGTCRWCPCPYSTDTGKGVASPLARPNPLSHVYVAVEPSKVPPGVATVASLTAGGDPQSAEERSHAS